MLANLSLGTLLIFATVLIHLGGMMVISSIADAAIERLHVKRRRARTVAMVFLVLGLFAVHTVEVWLWAFAYWVVGAVGDFPHALYFSAVTFSTLGYGDVLTTEYWRLFGALEGINGFLLIGWSTAFLVAASTRIGPFKSGHHF